MDKITTKEMTFVDNFGRERIFNGVNICDKYNYNLLSDGFSCPDKAITEQLHNLGFNVIRLGLTWAAYEPEINVYNDKIINKIIEFLDLCEEFDIYVFLDIHQDLYANFGDRRDSGDGAPKWATLTDSIPRGKEHFVWAEGYFFDKAVHRAFDNFWNNKEVDGRGLIDRFADCWKYIISKVKNHPAILGYDILNEPFPGADGGKVFKKIVGNTVKSILTDKEISRTNAVKSLITKKGFVLDSFNGNVLNKITVSCTPMIKNFDINKYSPFLNKISAAIREEDENGIIFIENCYYSNLGIPCSTPAISIGGKRDKFQCFSPHGYDLMVDTPQYKYASNSRIDAIFNEHIKTQKRLNVPVLVGEWGSESDGIGWLPHIAYILDIFDKNKWSNTYWAFNFQQLKQPIINYLSRPYPQAVTGQIEKYSYNRNSRKFVLSYNQDKEYPVPTVVYVPNKPIKIISTSEFELHQLSEKNGYIINIHSHIGKNQIEIYI